MTQARWKAIAVFVLIAMTLQLSVGVTPVLAEEDVSDAITELSKFVPLLSVTLSPGETGGATSATVTDCVYGNLLVNVTEQEIATPRVGDKAPSAGDNLIVGYEPGADITAGVAAGSFLQVYNVDLEDEARIIAFYQAELTEKDIREESVAGENPEEADVDETEQLPGDSARTIVIQNAARGTTGEADYIITNGETGFLVNGAGPGSGSEYSSLQEALNACSDDGSRIISFGSPGKPLEIDEVSAGNALISATYQGSIVIKEKVPQTSYSYSYGLAIPDSTTVVFSDLTISATPDMDNWDFSLVYMFGGSLTIEEGTVITADSPRTTAVCLSQWAPSGSSLTVNGGEISATDSEARCITNWSSGAVLIQGGAISAHSALYSVGNYGSGSLTISGGTISSSDYEAIYSQGSGAISISGDAMVYSEKGYGIRNSLYDDAAINTINISGDSEVSGYDYAIFNKGGIVTISGGSVIATKEDGAAIYSTDNVVEISGGRVEGAIGIWSFGKIIVSENAWIKGRSSYAIISLNSSNDINNPAMLVSSGTVEGEFGAIDNIGGGVIKITGGNVTGGDSSSCAVCNEGSGIIEISGGTVCGGDTVVYNPAVGNIKISNTAEIR
ncbi:MAG: hypothetical protein ACOX2S_05455 [bacterium]